MKKIYLLLFEIMLISNLLWAQDVTNVTASQRTDGSKLLDVFYDLAGTEPQYTVTLEISFDDGQTFVPVTLISGDVGIVAPATGLQITWDAAAEFPDGFYNEAMKVKVNAEAAAGWQCGDILVDTRDGQEYETVQIGEQCWMAENLAYLPTVSPSTSGSSDSPYYYVYGYEGTDVSVAKTTGNFLNFGVLFNWPASRVACPMGWHLPFDNEWKILEGETDSEYPVGDPEWDNAGYRGFDVGKNLKSTSGWNDNGNGLNVYGFSVKPGGTRFNSFGGSFGAIGGVADFWTQYDAYPTAWGRQLSKNSDQSWRNSFSNASGLSVRCLKEILNLPPEEPNYLFPLNGGINQPIELNLIWSCSDLENDALTYDVYFATYSNGPIVASGITDTVFNPGTLEYSTQYWWKVNVHDSFGNTTFGSIISFITEEEPLGFTCSNILTDNRDGQEYPTVQIGNQCWMAKNLNIGTRIDGGGDQTNNGTIEKYCYNNSEERCDQYGGLYQWDEMMQYTIIEGVQGICPLGWHIPTDNEWAQLVDYVASQGYPNSLADPNGASNALKSCRQQNSPLGGNCFTDEHPRWENSHSTNHGFDFFGFGSLPGGYYYSGTYNGLGTNGYWRSCTQSSSNYALYMIIININGYVYSSSNYTKTSGLSVRCLR